MAANNSKDLRWFEGDFFASCPFSNKPYHRYGLRGNLVIGIVSSHCRFRNKHPAICSFIYFCLQAPGELKSDSTLCASGQLRLG